MADLSDELRQRLAVMPDQWTLAWWEERFQEVLKGYRGATHAINRALAENSESWQKIEELRQRVQELESRVALELEADRARIGELQARVERMADFLNKSKGQKL